MSKIVGGRFGQDTLGLGSSFVTAGFGAAEMNPQALTQPYDLNQPGRISEVKQALATVAQADQGAESLWRVLTPDDVWEDAAQDEFVVFLSRWMSQLPCYPAPLMTFTQGCVQPTFTSLLMLDAAYRYVTSQRFVPGLPSCETGVASGSLMAALEQFLTGAAPTNFEVPLLRPNVEQVSVTPTYNVTPHPIPPPDVDAALYATWTSINDGMKTAWSLLAKTTTDTARIANIQALNDMRADRDRTAGAIIAKALPRTGTTTVEQVGTCTPPEVFDPTTKRCVTPAPAVAGVGLGGWAVLASLAGLFWWGFSGTPRTKRRA